MPDGRRSASAANDCVKNLRDTGQKRKSLNGLISFPLRRLCIHSRIIGVAQDTIFVGRTTAAREPKDNSPLSASTFCCPYAFAGKGGVAVFTSSDESPNTPTEEI